MKTDVRFTPRALIIFTGLLSALFIATSSVVFVHTNTANAQTRSFDQRLIKLKTDIDRLIKKGRYVPALVKAKLYVRLMARKVGTRHPNYARALQLQAKVYRYLKRPAEAQKFEIRAATILKNHAIFIAKQSADIRSARTKANKFEWEMHAKMLRERRAQQQATLPKKRALHSVQKNTAKPGGSYKRKMRTSRTTRSQPKPVMRRKKATSKERTVSKSIAPPAPIATPSPPIALPRSDIGGTSGSTAPADDNASFDLFAESGDEEARSATPKQPVKTKTSPGAAVAVGNENHTVVKVYFATDRQRTASTKLASLFGGQPSDPKRISYGICEVSIPKGHKPGALETPSIWRFEFKENPDKHVVLLKVHPQEKKSYFHNLKSIISRSKGQNAFIFIHGYNVTFTDAARRTAQITYDLGFDGAPVFYSWPSTGELGGYPTDEENVAWAQENVKQFLKDFVEQTDAKNIYLVAHSMGSRALTGAVSSLVVEAPQFKKRFKEIILAAPDISARIFKDNIAPKMIQASNNITLYVSSDDKALLASRKFHANPRAGEAGENIIIFKGIDTIDATGIDASLLAHSYFAEAKSIISDILAILKGEPPSGRKTLKPINTRHGIYWAFTK